VLSELIETVGAEAGYSVVSSNILSSTDVTTKQLLGMANRVIAEMAEAYNWTRLIKTGTFTLATDIATYALPADFSQYHYNTFWNQSTEWPLYGPLSLQEYAERIGTNFENSLCDEFQIRGVTDKEITIYPEPDSGVNGEVIVYQYTSARYVRPQTFAQGLSVTSGSYIFNNGNYYTAGSTGTTGATAPTHTSGSVTDGTITWTYYAGKYEKFLADTDVPVISQRILEQGVMERFGGIKKLDVMPLFLSQLEDEYGKNINGKVLYAGGRSSGREQWAKSGTGYVGSRFN
jgi:hypothetical protein